MSRDPSHQTWAEVWPLQGIDSLAGRLATLLLGEKSDTVADNFKIPHNFSRRFWFFPDKCSPWDSIHSLFSYLLTLHNKDDGSDYLAVGAGHLINRGRFQGLIVLNPSKYMVNIRKSHLRKSYLVGLPEVGLPESISHEKVPPQLLCIICTVLALLDSLDLTSYSKKCLVGRPWWVPATQPDPNFFFCYLNPTRTIFQNFRV